MTDDPARLARIPGLLRFCLPFAAGAGLGYFMHFINRLFLSWWSTDALAAAMPAGFLAWTIQGFFIMAAAYLGTFAAQHHGAGERREAGSMVWPMLVVGLGATVASLALIPARHWLVGLFGTAPEVASPMAALFAWYMAETGPITLAAGMAGFVGGIGRPGLVLVMSIATCLLSVALNRWFIFGGLGIPGLGVHGAGLATLVTSLAVLGAWCGFVFGPRLRREYATWEGRNLDRARLGRFLRYALPRGGTEILEMAGFMAFTGAITHLGTAPLAAHNLVFSIYLLVLVPVIGFLNGLAVVVGQLMGAGRIDLARQAARRAAALAVGFVGLAGLAFVLLPDLVLAPYAAGDPADPDGSAARWAALSADARPLLLFAALAMVADALQFVFRSAVQGAGDTRWPLAVLTALAVLLMALPAGGLTALAQGGRWPAWAPSPLHANWLVLVGYVWVVAGVMWARWRFGPWPGMSVRN